MRGHRIFRTFAIAAVPAGFLAFSSCAQDAPPQPPPPAMPTTNMCREPRPQMCMEIYQPVCGIRKDHTRKTFPNSCHACADPDVVHFIPGACGEPPK
jgi:hypothetical protein